MKLVDRYMNERFNFGGEILTRAEIYKWYSDNGYTQREADYWLMGAEIVK